MKKYVINVGSEMMENDSAYLQYAAFKYAIQPCNVAEVDRTAHFCICSSVAVLY